MFIVFREFNLPALPVVSSNLLESKIREWKCDPVVKKCYENLFKKIKNTDHETHMSRIIQLITKEKKNYGGYHL